MGEWGNGGVFFNIHYGADDYADHVLDNIEQQLTNMLQVIRNGRQQLGVDENLATPLNSTIEGVESRQ